MADLVPDIHELTRSIHLEDKQLFFLQCAMEENCLSSSAYEKEVIIIGLVYFRRRHFCRKHFRLRNIVRMEHWSNGTLV